MNAINGIMGKPKEYPFSDVWRNIFETDSIVDVNNCAIKIEKSGKLITAGLLKVFPAPHVEHKELVLYNTDFVKELFEDDKHKKLKERVFPQTICEFYDINSDLLLKFYSLEEYDKLCESENENKPD